MKLAIHNSALVWGGNEKWIQTLVGGLMARGHEVVITCRADGEVARRFRASGVPVSGVRHGVLKLRHMVAFTRWLHRERPDALLLTSWRGSHWGAAAARLIGVPRIVHRLGLVRTPEDPAMMFAFRHWVDGLIVNAGEIKQAWERNAPGIPQNRIHVVLNGIQPVSVDRAGARSRLLKELGAADGTLLIAGAGHLIRQKGFDVLLEAFARADLPDARLVLAGSGSELAALQRLAEERGIAERVHWLGHRDDVIQVLAGCSMFVLSSRNEGMANVMLEAMSAGTPVVASEVSGVGTALGPRAGDARAGWIVPAEDPGALADTLREVAGRLRTDPAEVAARVTEAARRVKEQFGVDRMVTEVEALLWNRSGV